MGVINKLRHGRKDFLHQMSRLNERESAMATDMKHFAQAAHASLDDKEKLEARLKRQQFEYKQEGHYHKQTDSALQAELDKLDMSIGDANLTEEQNVQQERREDYAWLKSKRDIEQRRELRLGYLQNQVRGQEMDFQRLHRIIGVRFTPEKPESVHEIINASLKNEERNSSLLGFVSVQTQQVEALDEEVRQLETESEALLVAQQAESQKRAHADSTAQSEQESLESYANSSAYHEQILSALCAPTKALFALLNCEAPIDDGGLFSLKGCRPDTLVDYMREIGNSLKGLRSKALEFVPEEDLEQQDEVGQADDDDDQSNVQDIANEVLRGFLMPHVVPAHPSVMDLRKELEQAAQKQQAHKSEAFGRDDAAGAVVNPEANQP